MVEALILIATGALIGILGVSLVLRRSILRKDPLGGYYLNMPVFGEAPLRTLPRKNGIRVCEATEMVQKFRRFGRLLDVETMLRYARDYDVNFIGFDGDRKDCSWSPGRLAFMALSADHDGGYNVHLNPSLDRVDVAKKLSEETGSRLAPADVYPFLFLHEIGHTVRSGNKNYYAEVAAFRVSGRHRSLESRKELASLRRKVERYADDFALRELPAWRGLSGR